jgi:hypothetical protein
MYVFVCVCLEYISLSSSSPVVTNRTSLLLLSAYCFCKHTRTNTSRFATLEQGDVFSINLKELHFKVQIGMRWDDTPSTLCPVSIIAGDLQESFLTETHKGHPFIPTTNDLSHTNGKPEGTSLVNGGVKFGTVG